MSTKQYLEIFGKWTKPITPMTRRTTTRTMQNGRKQRPFFVEASSSNALLQHHFHVEVFRRETVDRAVGLQFLQRLVQRILQRLVAAANAEAHARAEQLFVRDGRSSELEARALRLLQKALRCRFRVLERCIQTPGREVRVDLILRLIRHDVDTGRRP